MATQLPRMSVVFAAITATAVASALSIEQSFTVPGVKVGDVVVANKPTAQTGLGFVARVDADNSVAIQFTNTNASTAVTPTAAEVWKFWVFRPDQADRAFNA